MAAIPWKWYVYKFFSKDVCVYVGKGSGSRFACQRNRFKEFHGVIVAYFKEEPDALAYEKSQILAIAPELNKALVPVTVSPWKIRLLPDEKDFQSWCDALGTREMAARILAAKPWSYLANKGIDIKSILSKIDNFHGVYHGERC